MTRDEATKILLILIVVLLALLVCIIVGGLFLGGQYEKPMVRETTEFIRSVRFQALWRPATEEGQAQGPPSSFCESCHP